MKDLKCVFSFQIRICFGTENMTNVYTYTSLNVKRNLLIDKLKLFNYTHVFVSNIFFGETLLHCQQMVAEFWLNWATSGTHRWQRPSSSWCF